MLIEYTRNNRRRNVNPKVGRLLIQRGLARAIEDEAQESPQVEPTPYATRMLTAAPEADPAPYGYKADGTPRKRPAPVRKTVTKDE